MPSYRPSSLFYLSTLLTILILCTLYGCGGSISEDSTDQETPDQRQFIPSTPSREKAQ